MSFNVIIVITPTMKAIINTLKGYQREHKYTRTYLTLIILVTHRLNDYKIIRPSHEVGVSGSEDTLSLVSPEWVVDHLSR